jgi:UDP-N-acetylmuramyl pentapeptide synthase
MRLPTREAIEATHAQALGEHMPESLLIQTDTRAIERGATFLALRGENFDGHDYVEEAFARGAVCAIVDSRHPAAGSEDGAPCHPELVEGCATIVESWAKRHAVLVVPDTLQAYLQLGGLARARHRVVEVEHRAPNRSRCRRHGTGSTRNARRTATAGS